MEGKKDFKMQEPNTSVSFEAVVRFAEVVCNISFTMSKNAGFDMAKAADYATHSCICILQAMKIPNTPEVQRKLAEVLTLQTELHYGQKLIILHDGQKPL